MRISGAVTVLFFLLPVKTFAQSYIKSDYVFSSTFKESERAEKLGSGDLLKISGAYTLPFSVKQNELGQITAWSATLFGSYSNLNNNGIAGTMNPDEVLNTSLNISHLRPLSKHWSLIASFGAGIYSESAEITWKSVLVNGAVIFVYRINDKVDVGLGAGITNSYGIPMAIPMAYLKLNLTGKYEVKIDLSTKVQIEGKAGFNDKFHLKLVAIEMDGISAVIKNAGKSMIYSSMMIKSYLAPEFKLGKSSTIFLGAGGVLTRSSRLSERSLKSLWDNFKDENEKYRFKPTGYLTIGFRYGF